MKKLGLQAAGYNYVNLDDCWSLKNRSASGHLVAGMIPVHKLFLPGSYGFPSDPVKFPSGIKNLTATLHKMGFKAGIYSDSGWFTCAVCILLSIFSGYTLTISP
jgi:alpha-galactosidase